MAKKKTAAPKNKTAERLAKLDQAVVLLLRLGCQSRDVNQVDKVTLANLVKTIRG